MDEVEEKREIKLRSQYNEFLSVRKKAEEFIEKERGRIVACSLSATFPLPIERHLKLWGASPFSGGPRKEVGVTSNLPIPSAVFNLLYSTSSEIDSGIPKVEKFSL